MMEKDSNHLVTIYRVMNMQVFGYRVSAKIVGGRARLDEMNSENENDYLETLSVSERKEYYSWLSA